MPKPSIFVVKFGGSLIDCGNVRDWIARLACWSREKSVIVVPGGGEFANAVRRVQVHCGFDDRFAHELALQSMHQLGEVISELSEETLGFADLEQLQREAKNIGWRLWVPTCEEYRMTAMPEDWSVTSDSIALWLAGSLNASELRLLKVVKPPNADPSTWSRVGYVDEYFSVLLNRVSCRVLAYSDCGAFD